MESPNLSSAKRIKTLVVVLMSMLCASCGTVFCTQEENVPALTITSSVPDAKVFLNGEYVGQTPYSHFGETVNIKKITVKKDGYKSQSQKPRKLKGWAYVNFIPWPMWNWIWGYFVDRSKPKCWKYKSDVFFFDLKKK